MSNTIRNLKDQVKRYFSSNTSLYSVNQGQPQEVAALEQQIDTAILLAANNARRFAEMRHDFAACDVIGRATVVDGAAVSLDEIDLDGKTISMKSVSSVNTVTDNVMTPIKVTTHKTASIESFKRDQISRGHRYGMSDVADAWCGDPYAIIHGRSLTVQPLGDYDLAIVGSRWADDYNNDDDTDFFLQRGFEFMQWQSIVELNHMLLKFVPRQEGTLAPPVQARDVALESLVIMDSYSVDGSIFHDL